MTITPAFAVDPFDFTRVPSIPSLGALAGAAVSALVAFTPVTAAPISTPVPARTGPIQDWTQQTFRKLPRQAVTQPLAEYDITFISVTEPRQSVIQQARSTAEEVVRIHHVSGLTWEQLARLLGVSRRTVHSWASGGRVAAVNLERLATVTALLESRSTLTPDENRVWLLSPQGANASLFDELRRSWVKGRVVEDRVGVRERLGLLAD